MKTIQEAYDLIHEVTGIRMETQSDYRRCVLPIHTTTSIKILFQADLERKDIQFFFKVGVLWDPPCDLDGDDASHVQSLQEGLAAAVVIQQRLHPITVPRWSYEEAKAFEEGR